MAQYIHELKVRLSKAQDGIIREYAAEYGMTLAGAARDLISKQGRYWRRTLARERYGQPVDSLVRLASSILEKHPDLTKAQLGWNLAKKTNRFVDMKRVEEAATRALRSRDLGRQGST